MPHILFVLTLAAATANATPQVTTQEFQTFEKCNHAAGILEKTMEHTKLPFYTYCLEK